MNSCVIIPSHNHHSKVASILAALTLPVYIIDDGSDEPAREALAKLHCPDSGIIVHRLQVNQGKGGAVMAGFRLAIEAGYTHAVQIDADGQHDLGALPELMRLAAAHPDALISGRPIYDASVPAIRKIGRWATHVWVWVETLSTRIADSMCGFRVYPLAAVEKLLAKKTLGRHMDFDSEIMVRLFWQGTDVIMTPVKVIYPPGNLSNFDVLKDNWRITKMHTRLVFTMLLCLPSILRHRPRRNGRNHWSALQETGCYWGLAVSVGTYRLLGRRGCRLLMMPVVFYFYVTGRKQRLASREFLTRAMNRPPTFGEGYRHFLNFAWRAVDTLGAWAGKIPPEAIRNATPETFNAMIADPRGALIVISHLGHADFARALLSPELRARMAVLTHTHHAENYNRILRRHYPQVALNLIQVTEIGPETMIHLQQHIERGKWVCIAGDRTAVLSEGHRTRVPFLGADAAFAHGPWILGALLNCPVYVLFCLPEGERYCLTVERFADRIHLPRGNRAEALHGYAAAYAARLEKQAKAAPLQWFNFFDFWG